MGTKDRMGTKHRIQYIYCLLYHRISSLLEIKNQQLPFHATCKEQGSLTKVLPTVRIILQLGSWRAITTLLPLIALFAASMTLTEDL